MYVLGVSITEPDFVPTSNTSGPSDGFAIALVLTSKNVSHADDELVTTRHST